MNLWWHRIPYLARPWPLLATSLSDGAYLIDRPAAAALGPPLALVIGLLLGWLRFSPGESYTFSLIVMGLMIVISGLGAGLGTWLWAGYVAGDFFLFRPTLLSSGTFAGAPLTLLARVGGPALLLYLLLGNLVVLAPLVASTVRRQTLIRLKSLLESAALTSLATPLGVLVQAMIYSALVYIWTQSVPLLIRPVWTWTGSDPTVAAMAPLQERGIRLVYLALLLGGVRVVLEHRALRRLEVLVPLHVWESALSEAFSRRRVRMPAPMKAVAIAALSTFLLSGLLSSWFEAVLIWLVVTGVMLLRQVIARKFRRWTRVLDWSPLVFRVAACWWLSYVIAQFILNTTWGSVDSFRPMLFATVVSLAAFAVLVPDSPPDDPDSQAARTS